VKHCGENQIEIRPGGGIETRRLCGSSIVRCPTPPASSSLKAQAAPQDARRGVPLSLEKKSKLSLETTVKTPKPQGLLAAMTDSVTNSAASAQLAATAASLRPLADQPVKSASSTLLTDPSIAPRVVDHTYTDYASVSDDELLRLDRDMTLSMLSSPDLSPEKKKLLEQLSVMPSKSGGSQAFPIRVRLLLNQCLLPTPNAHIIGVHFVFFNAASRGSFQSGVVGHHRVDASWP
jgi:hypothetical protein